MQSRHDFLQHLTETAIKNNKIFRTLCWNDEFAYFVQKKFQMNHLPS